MTTAVIQALATGLPAITTDHSGFPDQIHNGKNGFMVPEGDWKALAEKIIFYIDHPETWPSFSAYGRQLMVEKYDSKPLIDRQVNLYKRIIERSPVTQQF